MFNITCGYATLELEEIIRQHNGSGEEIS